MGTPYIRDMLQMNPNGVGGDFILFDDFEAAVIKWAAVAGSNGTLALITTESHGGNACMRFLQTSAFGGLPVTSTARRRFSNPPAGYCTIDFAFGITDPGRTSATAGFQSNIDNGAEILNVGLRFRKTAAADGGVEIETTAGGWTTTGLGYNAFPNTNAWVRVQLLLDLLNETYKQLRIGDVLVDLGDTALSTSATSGNKEFDFNFFLTDAEDAGMAIRVDNFIVRHGNGILAQVFG
jgi:hypothetical protein